MLRELNFYIPKNFQRDFDKVTVDTTFEPLSTQDNDLLGFSLVGFRLSPIPSSVQAPSSTLKPHGKYSLGYLYHIRECYHRLLSTWQHSDISKLTNVRYFRSSLRSLRRSRCIDN